MNIHPVPFSSRRLFFSALAAAFLISERLSAPLGMLAEGTRAVDRPIQPVTKACLSLPLGEVGHVLPPVPPLTQKEMPLMPEVVNVDGNTSSRRRRSRA